MQWVILIGTLISPILSLSSLYACLHVDAYILSGIDSKDEGWYRHDIVRNFAQRCSSRIWKWITHSYHGWDAYYLSADLTRPDIDYHDTALVAHDSFVTLGFAFSSLHKLLAQSKCHGHIQPLSYIMMICGQFAFTISGHLFFCYTRARIYGDKARSAWSMPIAASSPSRSSPHARSSRRYDWAKYYSSLRYAIQQYRLIAILGRQWVSFTGVLRLLLFIMRYHQHESRDDIIYLTYGHLYISMR